MGWKAQIEIFKKTVVRPYEMKGVRAVKKLNDAPLPYKHMTSDFFSRYYTTFPKIWYQKRIDLEKFNI